MLSSCSLGGPGHYQLIAYFTKTVSLYRSADVRVLGLKVGTVSSVQAKGDQVEVKLSINNGAVLPAGVRATLVPQSLLGARYVQLYPAWVDGQPRLNPDLADGRRSASTGPRFRPSPTRRSPPSSICWTRSTPTPPAG